MPYFRIAIITLITCFAVWGIGIGIFTASTVFSKPHDTAQTSDAIVVLTGGNKRVESGLALFASGKANHLFISGVHPDVNANDIRDQWNGETALPQCCLALGKTATTTRENARETADWIAANDIYSFRLVTSNYHMPRAYQEMHAHIPDIEILKHPIVQDDINTSTLRFWVLIFEEYHKFLLRFVQIHLNLAP